MDRFRQSLTPSPTRSNGGHSSNWTYLIWPAIGWFLKRRFQRSSGLVSKILSFV